MKKMTQSFLGNNFIHWMLCYAESSFGQQKHFLLESKVK